VKTWSLFSFRENHINYLRSLTLKAQGLKLKNLRIRSFENTFINVSIANLKRDMVVKFKKANYNPAFVFS